MDFGDKLKSGAKGALGYITKARLEIYVKKKVIMEDGKEKDIKPVGKPYFANLKSVDKKKTQERLEQFRAREAQAAGPTGEDPNREVKNTIKDSFDILNFTVQLNPSELSLDGSAGGNVKINSYTSNSGIKMGPASLIINLSFKLIFDRVITSKAFAAPVMNLSGAAQRVGTLVRDKKGTGSNHDSVQEEVEALVAALVQEESRLVRLSWGKNISYTGLVNNVNANYTMFNKDGFPIRAVVDINMVLADEKNEKASKFSNNDWFKRYKDAFSDNSSLVGVGDKVGGLLNL